MSHKIDTSLAVKVITRTMLEGRRARGENWQAIDSCYVRSILITDINNILQKTRQNYHKCVKELLETDPVFSNKTFFVLEHENFIQLPTSGGGVAVMHSFRLTPVQIYEPSSGRTVGSAKQA